MRGTTFRTRSWPADGCRAGARAWNGSQLPTIDASEQLVTRADLSRALLIQTAANAALVGGLLGLFRLIP